jgi:hypothetical protein
MPYGQDRLIPIWIATLVGCPESFFLTEPSFHEGNATTQVNRAVIGQIHRLKVLTVKVQAGSEKVLP